MKTKAQLISAFVPYLAVLIGLYLLKQAWIAILLYHAGMIVIMFSAKDAFSRGQCKKGWQAKIGIPVLIISGLGGVLIFLLWPIISQQIGNLQQLLQQVGLKGASWIIFCFYYAFIHPPIEQCFWRSYLGSPSKKLIPYDLLFAGYHFLTLILFVKWPWAVLSCMVLAAAAWFWRQLARITGGVLIPILSHWTADISVITAVLLLK